MAMRCGLGQCSAAVAVGQRVGEAHVIRHGDVLGARRGRDAQRGEGGSSM
jgi:hypothetical protein